MDYHPLDLELFPQDVQAGLDAALAEKRQEPVRFMTTISLKLPESLLREIEREAATRGVPKSAVIRDSLEHMLRKGRKPKKEVSCLDLMSGLVGHLEGPPDASTNPRYLEEPRISGSTAATEGR